ncbi:MAG: 3-phosphoglycerate dehydrogenase [Clostridia bacterium]
MYNIQKLNKISPVINDIFTENYNCGDDIVNPEGILLRSFKMADYEVGDRLLAIARAGAGVNNIPLDVMSEKGVVVFNTPGANANAVKELVVCGMLLASRDIIGGNKWVNTLEEDVAKATEKGKGNFAGSEISGKTLGIIGLGAIGILVAEACVALGLNVLGYDPYLSENNKRKLDKSIKLVNLDTIYEESDFITIHVPLLDSTKNMINADTLNKCKKGVVILNMARGGLVNVCDIKNAITSGKVKKYVVDFPTEDVLNVEGIIAFPHLGASTDEAEDNCAVMAANQLIDYIENGNIVNSVNFPCVSKEWNTNFRTCIITNGNISDQIDVGGLKMSCVRGDYGYIIIDTKEAVTIDMNDSILRVRYLTK